MKLQFFSNDNGYYFKVGNFSSNQDHILIHEMDGYHPTLRSAYRCAHRSIKNHPWLMAVAGYEEEERPVYVDRSAEEMIVAHYEEVVARLKSRIKNIISGKDPEDELENAYAVIKDIVSELIQIKDDIKEEYTSKIDAIISSLRSVVNAHMADLLAADAEQMAVMPEEMPEDMPDGMPEVPMEEDPMAFASNNTSLIKCASCEDDIDVVEELLCHYGEKASSVLDDHHKHVVFDVNKDDRTVVCSSVGETGKSPLIKFRLNDALLIDTIVPVGELGGHLCPLSGVPFYQRYWKPIVEKIGHFFVGGANVLLAPEKCRLPDAPAQSKNVILCGWNRGINAADDVELQFKSDPKTWLLKKPRVRTSQTHALPKSEYAEQDWANSMVRCIDENLATLYGKTGEVIQVIPGSNYIEIDVNFGRKTVRLTEQQVEIIHGL